MKSTIVAALAAAAVAVVCASPVQASAPGWQEGAGTLRQDFSARKHRRHSKAHQRRSLRAVAALPAAPIYTNDGKVIMPGPAPALGPVAIPQAGPRAAVRLAPAAGAGTVVSGKTGARATVSAQYAGTFQRYVDALEAAGARILFMGGNRRGHCSQRHKHSCGMALDVCQLARGVVDRRCGLPGRTAIAAIAERFGLREGGSWCHHDYGHAEAGPAAPACNSTTLTARRHRGR